LKTANTTTINPKELEYSPKNASVANKCKIIENIIENFDKLKEKNSFYNQKPLNFEQLADKLCQLEGF